MFAFFFFPLVFSWVFHCQNPASVAPSNGADWGWWSVPGLCFNGNIQPTDGLGERSAKLKWEFPCRFMDFQGQMAALWSSCVISCRAQALELHPFIPTSSTFSLQMFDSSSVRPKFELTSMYQWCDTDISAVKNPDYWNITEQSLQGLPWNLVGLAAIPFFIF